MRALAFALPLLRLRRPRLAALVTRRQLSTGFDGDRVNAPWTRDEDWRLWQARDEDLDAVAARFGAQGKKVVLRHLPQDLADLLRRDAGPELVVEKDKSTDPEYGSAAAEA